MFQERDKVFYPGHGVAVIDEIIEKSVAGKKMRFFKLKFLYNDMTVLIPVDGNSQSSSIRTLSCKEDVEKALEELGKDPIKAIDQIDFSPSSWNKRNKEYQVKIQGGNLIEVAGIYRDLMLISKEKELSFGEKAILSSTEQLLVQEIGVVKRQDKEDVLKEIRSPFLNRMPFSAKLPSSPTSSI